MASLLDIADVPRTIEVRGKNIAVYGVSGRGIASLMARFPEIGKLMSGMDVNRDTMLKLAPDALAAFLAAGTGSPGDEAAEKVAADLSIGDQLELVDEILRLTFPRGIRPFVAKLEALGLLAEAQGPLQPASPAPSNNSSPPGTETL